MPAGRGHPSEGRQQEPVDGLVAHESDRASSSWASVSGWKNVPAPPDVAIARAVARHASRVSVHRMRRGRPRPSASRRDGGSIAAAVSSCAKGLRSIPTPMRRSSPAWTGTVPRPQNGSRTTSPGRLQRAMRSCASAAGRLPRYVHMGWRACGQEARLRLPVAGQADGRERRSIALAVRPGAARASTGRRRSWAGDASRSAATPAARRAPVDLRRRADAAEDRVIRGVPSVDTG